MKTSSSDTSKRVDTYFNSASPFAREICFALREIILAADPGIVEEWKWGPHYSKNGKLCGIGAFKNHVSLAFFRGASMKDSGHRFVVEKAPANSMRRMKFETLAQINRTLLRSYIQEALALNARGIKDDRPALTIPRDIKLLLTKSKPLQKYFGELAYTHRKEYIRWIEEAKKPETRQKRLSRMLQMLRARIKHP